MSTVQVPSREETLRAADGMVLAVTRFEPPARVPPLAPVIVAGATAVPRGYYGRFARFLAGRGHPVTTFDYRGVGGSRPRSLRGFDARMQEWGRLDLEAVLARVAAEHPDTPPLLVGHSVGGQILPLAPSADRLAAVLLVASQSGAARHWRGLDRLRLAAFWYAAVPLLTRLHGYLPGYAMGSAPLPAGIAREWARWGRHPDYILGYHPELRQRFRDLAMPLRLYSFPDDFYAPRAAAAELLSWYGGTHREHRFVTPAEAGAGAIGHFGFFRDTFAPTLWAEAADWLEARQALAPAPVPPG
ncbi:alpha/beta fold hydrolase [Rhodocista pekingensis]|uniref:Alpha/beta fold hydrolase n=1 Tax=Rhodocista pekingensis TaxID=201185 RepID=A0ABW2KTA2_9PROT